MNRKSDITTLINDKRNIDFTDKELYYVALSLRCYLNDRDTWIGKGGAKILNSVLKKVRESGMKRKNPKSILHPIKNFDDEQ